MKKKQVRVYRVASAPWDQRAFPPKGHRGRYTCKKFIDMLAKK